MLSSYQQGRPFDSCEERQWHCDKEKFITVGKASPFLEIDLKAVCLICKRSASVFKEYNLWPHYETWNSSTPVQVHQRGNATQECNSCKLAPSLSEVDDLSHRVFVQQCAQITHFFAIFPPISLARNTVTWHIEDIAGDFWDQIIQRVGTFCAFSIVCDESTGAFQRGVNEKFEMCQELAGLETEG